MRTSKESGKVFFEIGGERYEWGSPKIEAADSLIDGEVFEEDAGRGVSGPYTGSVEARWADPTAPLAWRRAHELTALAMGRYFSHLLNLGVGVRLRVCGEWIGLGVDLPWVHRLFDGKREIVDD